MFWVDNTATIRFGQVLMITGGAVGMDAIADRKDWPILAPGYSSIYG